MERAILSLTPANILTIWVMLALLYLAAVGISYAFTSGSGG